MRAALHVATRELIERKLIFVAALVLGLLILASPLLPMPQGAAGGAFAEVLAILLSFGFAVGLSFLMGATVFGRDLAERRRSFYFSKPLSSPAIWGGKILASFAMAIGAGVLVVLPLVLTRGDIAAPLIGARGGQVSPAVAVSMLCLLWIALGIGVGHLASIALRSRSPWVALQVFGLP